MLLAHGERDTAAACSHSAELNTASETSGARVELWAVPDVDHVRLGATDSLVKNAFERSPGFAGRLVSHAGSRETAHRPPAPTTEP